MKLTPSKKAVNHRLAKHGGIYSRDTLKGVIDFSSNVNPLGPPLAVSKGLQGILRKIDIYPDSKNLQIRKKLAEYLKVDSSQILIGNGAIEIIYNFSQVFISKNTPVLIPIPTFSEYDISSKLYDGKIIYFKTMNLDSDVEKFIKKIPKNGCVFICNPNNPTSTILDQNKILQILDVALSKSTLVFIDECFIELVSDDTISMIKYIKKYENLFVLRSFTKSFGLAGIRIGYAIASPKIIKILNNVKIPWSVNGIAEHLAQKVLSDKTYLINTRRLVEKESKYLQNCISEISGMEPYPSVTNFILIKTKLKSITIQNKLLKKNILIRDCSSFKGLDDHHIRIAVKSHKENQKLVCALRELH